METILSLIHRIDETIRTAGMLSEEEDRAFREQIEQRISAVVREAEASDLHWAETWFRPAEAELLRGYLRRAVSSRTAMTAPVYNHLLIGTEPELLKQAQDFTKRFAGLAARFFDENEAFFVCVMTERQLLACRQDNYLNTLPLDPVRCRILLVPDFRAEDPERLLEVLDDPKSGLGIGRYSVILCGEEAAAEKVREYAGKDFRLGRYVLGKTHHFGTFTEQDVHEHTCRQLDLSGFAVTDEFRDRLELYIRAVYPEAVFRGKQFVNDLLIRIADARADRLCFGKTLTAADVPYSRKAERLAETAKNAQDISPYAAKRIAKPVAALSPDCHPVTDEIPDILTNEIVRNPGKAESGSAIILLFLSINRKKADQEPYIASDGRGGVLRYNGMLTNDAPLQHLLDCARLDGHERFRLLPILTSEVSEDEAHNLGRLERLVASYSAAYGLSACDFTYHPIILPKQASPDALSTVVFQHVSTLTRGTGQDIYVDFTGGFRDISMLMVTITRYLEFSGCKLRKIVYVKYEEAKRPTPIVDIEGIYDQLNLINGTGSFLETGNPQELEKALPELQEHSPEKELLDAIQDFSNAMSVCSVSGIEENVIRIREKTDMLVLPQEGEVLLKSEMLRFLGPTIRAQMKLDDIVTEKGNQAYSVNYPILISWCVENRLIQQAVTLYTEKIPFWYYPTLFSPELPSTTEFDAGYFFSTVCEMPFNAYLDDFKRSLLGVISICDESPMAQTRRCYTNELQKQASRSAYAKPFNALGRLLYFINYNYDEQGFRKNESSAGQDLNWAGNTVRDLLQTLRIVRRDNQNLLRFLCGDEAVDRRSRYERKSYQIKTISLSLMRTGMYSGFTEKQKKAIAFYLAIKLVRNQMNHASDDIEDGFTKDLVAELRNYGIRLSLRENEDRFLLSYQEAMTLLENATSFNKQLINPALNEE